MAEFPTTAKAVVIGGGIRGLEKLAVRLAEQLAFCRRKLSNLWCTKAGVRTREKDMKIEEKQVGIVAFFSLLLFLL